MKPKHVHQVVQKKRQNRSFGFLRKREFFTILFFIVYILISGYEAYLYNGISFGVAKNLETLTSTMDPLKSSIIVEDVMRILKEKKLTKGLVSFWPENPIFEVVEENQKMEFLMYRLEFANISYKSLVDRLEKAEPRPKNIDPAKLDQEFLEYTGKNPKVRVVMEELDFFSKIDALDKTLVIDDKAIIPKNLHLGNNLRVILFIKYLSAFAFFISIFWFVAVFLVKAKIYKHFLKVGKILFLGWRK